MTGFLRTVITDDEADCSWAMEDAELIATLMF